MNDLTKQYKELLELVKSLRHYQLRYRQFKSKQDLASAQKTARLIDKHLQNANQLNLL